MRFGIERLLSDDVLLARLSGARIALVGHPASVDHDLNHSIDRLASHSAIDLSSAFGPQHGLRGDKQDNMIETADEVDEQLGIPIYSLYGEVRRPTEEMLDSCDVVLFDIQDLGTRIYTFLTTLLYVLEECAKHGKQVWVLDRPNPAGRGIDGLILLQGNESFVGASTLPMSHGLTLGEAAKWFVVRHKIDVDLTVVAMDGYDPDQGPGFGWDSSELAWVNPSPNAASLNMARCYPGTVLLEGTTLSEGRGTTIPLEVMGAPDIEMGKVFQKAVEIAPDWMTGCLPRPCWFEPTFHKHSGVLCSGLQMHADYSGYNPDAFKPYRFVVGLLCAVRVLYPGYEIWRHHKYEYAFDRPPIDVIDGGPTLREFVDGEGKTIAEFEAQLSADCADWKAERAPFLLY